MNSQLSRSSPLQHDVLHSLGNLEHLLEKVDQHLEGRNIKSTLHDVCHIGIDLIRNDHASNPLNSSDSLSCKKEIIETQSELYIALSTLGMLETPLASTIQKIKNHILSTSHLLLNNTPGVCTFQSSATIAIDSFCTFLEEEHSHSNTEVAFSIINTLNTHVFVELSQERLTLLILNLLLWSFHRTQQCGTSTPTIRMKNSISFLYNKPTLLLCIEDNAGTYYKQCKELLTNSYLDGTSSFSLVDPFCAELMSIAKTAQDAGGTITLDDKHGQACCSLALPIKENIRPTSKNF